MIMEHDDLCRHSKYPDWCLCAGWLKSDPTFTTDQCENCECVCDIIAQARQDERLRVLSEIKDER